MNLALNNPRRLICHEITNKQTYNVDGNKEIKSNGIKKSRKNKLIQNLINLL